MFSFAICMYELLHKYMMVFAISINGTEEEIEAYAQRVAGGYRCGMAEWHGPLFVCSVADQGRTGRSL